MSQHLASCHRKLPKQIPNSNFEEVKQDSLKTSQPEEIPIVQDPEPPSLPVSPVRNPADSQQSSGRSKKSKLANQSEPSSVVQQLIEMGFSRKSIENAVSILSATNVSPSPETLVAWLLEQHLNSPEDVETDERSNSSVDINMSDSYSVSEDEDVDDDDDIDVEFEDIDASGHEVQAEVYLKRSDFVTDDEYAMYVRDHIALGMTVQCLEDFEVLHVGDTGKVVKVERERLGDLNIQVGFTKVQLYSIFKS